jgi:hypothetical protein
VPRGQIAIDEMKQMSRDEEVALKFIVRGFVQQLAITSLNAVVP